VIQQLVGDAALKQIDDHHRECSWNVVNKYYRSNITLTIINDVDSIPSPHCDLSQCSAIILVVDLNQSQSAIAQDREQWVDVLSPYLSNSECTLLIGNYVDRHHLAAHRDHSAVHQSLHKWSVDHCFEFVPFPHCPSPSASADDEKASGHNPYGSDSPLFAAMDVMEYGHRRISSALQCVMWPDMIRNPPPKRNLQSAQSAESVGSVQPLLSEQKESDPVTTEEDDERKLFRKGDEVTLMGLQSKQHWNGRRAVVVGSFSKSKRRWPVEVVEEEETLKKALIRTKNLVLERKGPRWNEQPPPRTVKGDEKESGKVDGNGDQERESKEFLEKMLWDNRKAADESSLEQTMGSFESLMMEMQRVRNEAKSGNLTDEQRRQQAEEAVMKLMPFMGIEDEETESEAEKEAVEQTQQAL